MQDVNFRDLFFVTGAGLVQDLMGGGCLGHNDHEMAGFKILSVKIKNDSYPGLQESKSEAKPEAM